MEVTYIRAKVPNSFSRRIKRLINYVNESYLFTQTSYIEKTYTTTAREPSIYNKKVFLDGLEFGFTKWERKLYKQ